MSVVFMYDTSLSSLLSQSSVHFVTYLASWLVVYKRSYRAILAVYKICIRIDDAIGCNLPLFCWLSLGFGSTVVPKWALSMALAVRGWILVLLLDCCICWTVGSGMWALQHGHFVDGPLAQGWPALEILWSSASEGVLTCRKLTFWPVVFSTRCL